MGAGAGSLLRSSGGIDPCCHELSSVAGEVCSAAAHRSIDTIDALAENTEIDHDYRL